MLVAIEGLEWDLAPKEAPKEPLKSPQQEAYYREFGLLQVLRVLAAVADSRSLSNSVNSNISKLCPKRHSPGARLSCGCICSSNLNWLTHAASTQSVPIVGLQDDSPEQAE